MNYGTQGVLKIIREKRESFAVLRLVLSLETPFEATLPVLLD